MKADHPEILFISDLHLSPDRPHIIKLFSRFVNERAIYAGALYILGDFFEYWIGDDDPADGLESVFTAFDTLKKNKTPVYFMHGNRDFLIGSDFEQRAHCQIIPDPQTITINQQAVVLMHGDSLCTKDIKYQEFKTLVRSETWQKMFTEKTLAERKSIVASLRKTSQSETSIKDEVIMDVDRQAVEDLFHTYKNNYLIHGHTHRPDIHQLTVDNKAVTRIVLGDWYEKGSLLSISNKDDTGDLDYKLESFQ
ncbi:MAG: UDP-2,3-diacylglucosamine diphosphatase [Gammaproteobacteria bacterium]|nr:UDP-2,3-diacylglucosamine diphosphatase [Gammaproteobacteria bacterium]